MARASRLGACLQAACRADESGVRRPMPHLQASMAFRVEGQVVSERRFNFASTAHGQRTRSFAWFRRSFAPPFESFPTPCHRFKTPTGRLNQHFQGNRLPLTLTSALTFVRSDYT